MQSMKIIFTLFFFFIIIYGNLDCGGAYIENLILVPSVKGKRPHIGEKIRIRIVSVSIIFSRFASSDFISFLDMTNWFGKKNLALNEVIAETKANFEGLEQSFF